MATDLLTAGTTLESPTQSARVKRAPAEMAMDGPIGAEATLGADTATCAADVTDSPIVQRTLGAVVNDLIQLTKPRIVVMILVS